MTRASRVTLNDSDADGGASGITYFKRRLEKARASYDIHHRWVTTITYELPFGKGRKWMNAGGVKNVLLGGWELVWIQTFHTGPPFTVGFGGSPYNYLPGAGNRPTQLLPNDQVKRAHVDIGPHRFPFSAQKRYLDLNGFQYPAAYTIGAVGRNSLEAPGVVWPQTSVTKTWTILEKLRFRPATGPTPPASAPSTAPAAASPTSAPAAGTRFWCSGWSGRGRTWPRGVAGRPGRRVRLTALILEQE